MIHAIVTDIEGTTSSLSFVKDVLFPYARAHLAEFIQQHGDDAAVRQLLQEARQAAGEKLDDAQLAARLLHWIDEDKKITPLKALQGMIWEQGYRRGHFTSHLYEDAVRNLRRWKEQGIKLYIFSSGSVQAQKLLFAHTEFGDLTPLFSGYFDTRIGAKREPGSYRAIAASIGVAPRHILFLSDIKEELDAARQAGMSTVWLLREGVILSSTDHTSVGNFDAIDMSS
ncbi:MAG TPA: acireductone synthase [Acidiferrobacterales bacterium]|nr:acireductone synthase [Acidiferrobacterales bacterium]